MNSVPCADALDAPLDNVCGARLSVRVCARALPGPTRSAQARHYRRVFELLHEIGVAPRDADDALHERVPCFDLDGEPGVRRRRRTTRV